jgi:hypothetical protein
MSAITLFDVVITARDAMSHAEITQKPSSLLPLDFSEAFEKISHKILFRMIKIYGFSEQSAKLFKQLYD